MADNLLYNQQLANAEALNKIIEKANEKILCIPGSDCYKQKHSEELKRIFLAKKENVETAPEQLDSARKNFFVYTYGQPRFIEEETQRLTKLSDEVISKMKEDHNSSLSTIAMLIGKFDTSKRYGGKDISATSIEFPTSVGGVGSSDDSPFINLTSSY